MKRVYLFVFLSIFILLVISVFSRGKEAASDESAFEVRQEDSPVAVSQEHVVRKCVDDWIMAVERDAQRKIQAVVAEINLLTDKSQEAELQKEIEKIKYDAEIARLTTQMRIAEDEGDFDIASEIGQEIDHLQNLDRPVIGLPEEQAAP